MVKVGSGQLVVGLVQLVRVWSSVFVAWLGLLGVGNDNRGNKVSRSGRQGLSVGEGW